MARDLEYELGKREPLERLVCCVSCTSVLSVARIIVWHKFATASLANPVLQAGNIIRTL